MVLGKFSISAKVFAIICVLGLAIIIIATTAVYALHSINDLSKRKSLATSEAMNGLRITQLVTSLNRAEFRIVADPSPKNVEALKQEIARDISAFEQTLTKIEQTADSRQKKMLDAVRKNYEQYAAFVDATIAAAEKDGANIQLSDLQKQLVLMVRNNHSNSLQLNDTIHKYVDFTGSHEQELTTQAHEMYQKISMMVISISLIALIAGISMGFVIARFGIVTPIHNIVGALKQLASGDLDVAVFGVDRRDEIGDIANTMQVFKDNMQRTRKMEQEAQEAEARAAEDKKRDMNALADRFEESVGAIVTIVSTASTELEAAATTLNSTLEETTSQAGTVAAAATQASSNVETVAAACEEMASAVREISNQVAHSSGITERAVSNAEATQQTAEGLSTSVGQIVEVIDLIQDIASQTNLLALNATIEAARAGEAGKGFAVVANEVKNLASQTAKATDNITLQIDGVRNVTENTVQAIREISQVISESRNTAASISAAIDQQDAATQEIARNISEASNGTNEVSGAIVQVSQAATEGGSAAAQVLTSAQELSRSATQLDTEIRNFLMRVRSA